MFFLPLPDLLLSVFSSHPQLWIAVGTALVMLAAAALYCGLTVKRYEIETDLLEPDRYLRIVHLSDLHSSRYGKGQRVLLDTVRELMPDVLFFTGDNIDDLRAQKAVSELFEGIRAMGISAYLVPGNHEMRIADLKSAEELTKKNGIRWLDMQTESVRIAGVPLLIAGAGDRLPYGTDAAYREELARAFSGVKGSRRLKLLLAHRPEYGQTYRELGFDAAFSGHAHGGQVRIPGLVNGLYAPQQGLFPKRAGGLYREGSFVHIVSRGLSRFWDMPRIFNPPEIVLCVFRGAKPDAR